jgi:hypothetical protein
MLHAALTRANTPIGSNVARLGLLRPWSFHCLAPIAAGRLHEVGTAATLFRCPGIEEGASRCR